MNAKEARNLTDQNIRPFDCIIEDIRLSASRGEQLICMPLVPYDHQMNLIELGYKVSKCIDPTGLEYTKIGW